MYGAATYNRTKDFIDTYGKDIIDAIRGTGLFFSAVVAQKALESGYGDSELAKRYNNFGGIKNFGSLPNAGVVQLDTVEIRNGRRVTVKQPFATFSTPRIAFDEYVAVLKDPTKEYTKMGVFTATTPEQQIKRMVQAGYSTMSPSKYLSLLQGIIDAARDYSHLGRIA